MAEADERDDVDERDVDETGGQPACDLHRVCETCGALEDGPLPPVCRRCGSMRPARAPLGRSEEAGRCW